MKKILIVLVLLLFSAASILALPPAEKRVYQKVVNQEDGSEYHQCLNPGTNCTV